MIFPSFNISVKMIFSIAYFDEQPIETPFLLISIINNWGKGGGRKLVYNASIKQEALCHFPLTFWKEERDSDISISGHQRRFHWAYFSIFAGW